MNKYSATIAKTFKKVTDVAVIRILLARGSREFSRA